MIQTIDLYDECESIYKTHSQNRITFKNTGSTLPWCLANSQSFYPGYQRVSCSGSTFLKSIMMSVFGSLFFSLRSKFSDHVLTKLESTCYSSTYLNIYSIKSSEVKHFINQLDALIINRWSDLYLWSFAEFFSFIQSCCRFFQIYYIQKNDLFLHQKKEQNQYGLAIYHSIREPIIQDKIPFSHLCYLVVRANWMDSVMDTTSFLATFQAEVNDVLDDESWVNDVLHCHDYFSYRTLLYDVKHGKKTILYECDNHGEICFDLLFIEVLLLYGHKVILSSKKHPVLNDVTYTELNTLLTSDSFMHLRKYMNNGQLKIIHNGSGDVICLRYLASESYIKSYEEADMVILKGQGNFDSYPTKKSGLVYRKKMTFKKPHYFLFGLKSSFTQSSFNFISKKVRLNSPILYYSY